MKRATFDLSFMNQTTLDMGYLIPIGCVDVLPGDTFRAKTDLLARVSPLAKPVMHPVQISVHNWFVPNRIIWSDWENFIVGNEGGATYPTITPATAADAVLYDYMGAEPVGSVEYDALPIRAYNLIWNEYYRDQDLSTPRVIDLSDGADTTTETDLARVSWGKDYFTTARANPQQGAAVEVGFSAGRADVKGVGVARASTPPAWTTPNRFYETGDTAFQTGQTVADGGDVAVRRAGTTDFPDVYADLSTATGGIDINELRNAISLQRIAEAREFFGSRYVDYLRWYGVNPRDGRLDRPEYLGGGKQQISFSEVLSTAQGASVDVGEMFGHGIAGLRQRPIRKMFEEHGWFITMLSVRPKSIYQNGIPRRFLRRQPTDFWHRELELLPWQSIDELEIYGGGTPGTVFGYTPRYDEYRETNSYVSGTFRGGTEEDWTLAREFASAPTLNESFITCTPSDRIYLDATQPEILATTRQSIRARRLVAATARMSNRAGL